MAFSLSHVPDLSSLPLPLCLPFLILLGFASISVNSREVSSFEFRWLDAEQ